MRYSKTDHPQRASVYFPADLVDELKEECRRQDRSMSWLIQRAWAITRDKIKTFPGAPDFSEFATDQERIKRLLDLYQKIPQKGHNGHGPVFSREGLADLVEGVIDYHGILARELPAPNVVRSQETFPDGELRGLYLRLGEFFQQYI